MIEFNGNSFNDWRLPSAGDNPHNGNNQTATEMGHLYYVSLEKPEGGPLGETDPFENLLGFRDYWYATEHPSPNSAWYFDFDLGLQSYNFFAG